MRLEEWGLEPHVSQRFTRRVRASATSNLVDGGEQIENRYQSKTGCVMRLLLLSLVWSSLPLIAQDDNALLALLQARFPSNRITVAMVPLENATGDSSLESRRFAIGSVLGPQLARVKALRLLPQTSLKYGLAQLHKNSGDPMDVGEAARLGEMIEARRVIWGSYRRDAGKWQVSIRILNVSKGTASECFTANSSDFFELRDKLTPGILKELRVTPTETERREMKGRWTKSTAAVEALAEARLALEQQRPAAEWEACSRRAIAADPGCAEAWAVLGSSIGTQGKMEEALSASRRAIKLNPQLAIGFFVLGQTLMAEQRIAEAKDPLYDAVLLEPDNPARFARLAECCMLEKDLANAVDYFKRALQLSPFQAALHANLGRAYLFQGKRESGLEELNEAERLTFEPDLSSEEFLAWGFERLNNAPAAIRHYQEALSIARKVGLNPERIGMLTHDLEGLKAATMPVFLNIHPPKDYTEETLMEALREKLKPEEQEALVRPLTTTAEMKSRALELTQGATNELQKARFLFDALAGHLEVGEHEMLTAPQAFAAWKARQGSFGCQEYALLYTMMARAAGLRAYFVTVPEAYDGAVVSHACAAVFAGDKALLVDPGYRWFGVPHKKFEVRNDLEATADYLSQVGGDIKFRRIAIKLDPDSAFAHFKLAMKYIGRDQLEEARAELPEVVRLDSAGAMAGCLKAFLALRDKRPDEAVELAKNALEKGWPGHDGSVHMILGDAYMQQGKFIEARTAFRAALRRSPDSSPARRAIARINETIGTD
jgi:tetratricopeptide (TPR) repeat protein/TolB-like protein